MQTPCPVSIEFTAVHASGWLMGKRTRKRESVRRSRRNALRRRLGSGEEPALRMRRRPLLQRPAAPGLQVDPAPHAICPRRAYAELGGL